MVIINRFNVLLNRRRSLDNRKYRLAEVARITGISRQALRYWYASDVTQYSDRTLLALCSFLDCKIGELLVIT